MAIKIWAPNERLTSADLNGNFASLAERAVEAGSGTLTLGTAYADVPGTDRVVPAGTYLVILVADMNVSSAGAGTCEAVLNIDGIDQGPTAVWAPASSVTGRATVAQVYLVTTPSSQTWKVRAKKSIAAGTASCVGTNTYYAIT